MRNLKRNVKALRTIGFVIDIINSALGLGILILSIFIVINIDYFVKLFPLVFLFAFIINFLIGLKYNFRDEKLKAKIGYVFSGLLLFTSIVGFIGLWR